MADLTGAWLGTYWQLGNPTRFEATFVQASNSLMGRITDDSALGEASLQGEVVGRQVSFTKLYLGHRSTSIRYTGTLSEDGNYISGEWKIDQKHAGPWEAQRSLDNLAQEFKSLLERKAPTEAAGVR